MADAYIFDHVRTPRGRGKPDGSLLAITPIQLAAQTLQAVRDRNGLDTTLVDDVVLGCVSPIGEQGANIARVAALVAGFDESVPGQQLNRFCASGLEAARSLRPDVVLLDIGLPDAEGFAVARDLAADGPPPLIVLTSSRDARSYGRRLTTNDVLGFIPKEQVSGAAIRALVDPG